MFKIQDPLTGILLSLEAISLALGLCNCSLFFNVLKQFFGVILAWAPESILKDSSVWFTNKSVVHSFSEEEFS